MPRHYEYGRLGIGEFPIFNGHHARMSPAMHNQDRDVDRIAFARLVARVVHHVGERLGRDLLSTPALDMMLDLYLRVEHRPISLTSLCGATAVPDRTALFTIDRLVKHGLLTRHPDPHDGRRVNVDLSAGGLRLLDECIEELMELIAEGWP
jgi:DNA-binding MarR family transcriptional regulator